LWNPHFACPYGPGSRREAPRASRPPGDDPHALCPQRGVKPAPFRFWLPTPASGRGSPKKVASDFARAPCPRSSVTVSPFSLFWVTLCLCKPALPATTETLTKDFCLIIDVPLSWFASALLHAFCVGAALRAFASRRFDFGRQREYLRCHSHDDQPAIESMAAHALQGMQRTSGDYFVDHSTASKPIRFGSSKFSLTDVFDRAQLFQRVFFRQGCGCSLPSPTFVGTARIVKILIL
jgi:hypothetical protein